MTHPNPTFYATVINLTAITGGEIPATQGRLAHGAFFDLIRAVDPALAEALHVPNQRRPFTISPLQGNFPEARNGHIAINPGQRAWLRFTLLDSALFAAFTRFLLLPPSNRQYAALRLGGVDFIITEMLTSPGSHRWAGYTSFNDLYRPDYPQNATSEIAIQFASPTVFSRGNGNGLGKIMEPFPHPGMFFGSLAAAWNAHSPHPVDPVAVRTYAEQTVVVGTYKMESAVFRYWAQPQIGAVGRVTYHLKDRANPLLFQTLHHLANFAFYSGVGYKTTMGMGMARRLDGPLA